MRTVKIFATVIGLVLMGSAPVSSLDVAGNPAPQEPKACAPAHGISLVGSQGSLGIALVSSDSVSSSGCNQ